MASALLDNQVEEIARGLSTCSFDDNEKIMIETELKLMDIHFNWNLHQAKPDGDNPDVTASELKRKLKEMLDNDSELKFKSFCCQLTMAQEVIKYDTVSALKIVKECEPWVISLKNGTCQEHEFLSISEAVEYIYLGCKAFVLFKCGSVAEAKEELRKVPDLKKMEDKQRSGIYGVKACAYMEYGVSGFLKALECISIARSKHSTMAEWHFLTGKIMSRIRHVKFPFMTVSDEEENFYRTAHKLNEDERSYALYMAQITREKAAGLFQECRYDRENNKETLERVDKMNAEALSLYMKMIQSNQTDSHILGRSAFGMVKLPYPYTRIDLAVQAIEKALEISPDNPMVNHYAGLIYYRHVKDNYKGLMYLERAVRQKNFPALLDWLKLKYFLDPDYYDPIPELTKALEFDDYVSATLTEMSSWYFFKKDDVFRAWDHLKKVTDDHFAKNHKSSYLRMKSPCNLFEVIFDEVKLMISQGKYRNEGEKETLRSISKKLQTICPQSHPTDYSNFKAVILNESDRLIMIEQSRRYGRGGARNIQRGRSSSARGSTFNGRGSTSNVRGGSSNGRGGLSNGRGGSSNERGGSSNGRGGFHNGRGGSSNGRGGSSNSRGGSNIDRSSCQTGLNIVEGEKKTNQRRRDTRSRGQGKSDRGRTETSKSDRDIKSDIGSNIEHKNCPVSENNKLDLAEGFSMKNVLTEKLIDLDSEFKNNLNILFGNKLTSIGDNTQKSGTTESGNKDKAEAGCSEPNLLFVRKKSKNHDQPLLKLLNENESSSVNEKYDNFGNQFTLNVDKKHDNNNFSGSQFPEHANKYKNPSNASSRLKKTQLPPHSLNIAPQASSSRTSNITSEIKYDNFGKKITQKSLNSDNVTNVFSDNVTNVFSDNVTNVFSDNVTNDFSEKPRKPNTRKDVRPSYFPKNGSQASNFTTNTF